MTLLDCIQWSEFFHGEAFTIFHFVIHGATHSSLQSNTFFTYTDAYQNPAGHPASTFCSCREYLERRATSRNHRQRIDNLQLTKFN